MRKLFYPLAIGLAMMASVSCEKGGEKVIHTVEISSGTGGKATATVDGKGVAEVEKGVKVTLTATADTDHKFTKWITTGVALADPSANPATFTMPDDNVAVKAEFTPKSEIKKYTVTLKAGTGGTAAATVNGKPVTEVAEGDVIALTATPDAGYKFTKWTAAGMTLTDPAANPTTFTMPANNVAIEGEFATNDAQKYSIKVTAGTGGTADATVNGKPVTEAAEGDVITLTAAPDDGYHFTEWDPKGVTLPDSKANPATFTMPANYVVIGAKFAPGTKKYSMTLEVEWGGHVTAKINDEEVITYGGETKEIEVEKGTTMTLTVTVYDNREFTGWIPTGVTLSDPKANPLTVTMPAHDIAIKADIENTTSYNVTVVATTGGSASASTTSSRAGAKVSLTATADSGYEFVKWAATANEPWGLYDGMTRLTDPSNPSTDFIMPAGSDITVKAIFKSKNTDNNFVLINGVKWAPVNVGEPGKFAACSEDVGMIYQWGKKIGWSSTDPMVASNGGTKWDMTLPTKQEWTPESDPSPAGWRVPTYNEMLSLVKAPDKVTEEAVHDPKTKIFIGRKFTDKATGNSIFIPASGRRWYEDGSLDATVGAENVCGNYWTASYEEGYTFIEEQGKGTVMNYPLLMGYAVRPVIVE